MTDLGEDPSPEELHLVQEDVFSRILEVDQTHFPHEIPVE